MTNIFAIEDRKHRETLARVRIFRERFNAPVKVEPEAPPRPDGVIYERARTRLTITEALRRIGDVKIPTPAENEIRDQLYPGSSK